jgi:hypothetical protein
MRGTMRIGAVTLLEPDALPFSHLVSLEFSNAKCLPHAVNLPERRVNEDLGH